MSVPVGRPAMIGNIGMNQDRSVRRATQRELRHRAPEALSTDVVDPLAPGTCSVYRLWNHGGVLLYVGIADDPKSRWKQHRSDKEWWPDVYQKSVTWYRSREAAQQAEAKAIADEWPLYNRAGVPDDLPTFVVVTPKALLEELGHREGRRTTLWLLYRLHHMVNVVGSIRDVRSARLPIDIASLRESYGEIYRRSGSITRRVHMWLVDNVYNVRWFDGYDEHMVEREHFYSEQRRAMDESTQRFLAEEAKQRKKISKRTVGTTSTTPRRKRAPAMADLKDLSPDLRDAVKAAVAEEVKRQKAAATRRAKKL